MKKNKGLRALCNSVDRANFYIRRYIGLCRISNPGVLLRIRKLILRNALHRNYNIIIGDECSISEPPLFPHPQNIVIGSGTHIGNNCIIYHDVTVGQNRGAFPQIGNGVIIYSGAKIIGNVKISDGAVVGANSVVTRDVPQNAIVGGIPAKVIRFKEIEDVFY